MTDTQKTFELSVLKLRDDFRAANAAIAAAKDSDEHLAGVRGGREQMVDRLTELLDIFSVDDSDEKPFLDSEEFSQSSNRPRNVQDLFTDEFSDMFTD